MRVLYSLVSRPHPAFRRLWYAVLRATENSAGLVTKLGIVGYLAANRCPCNAATLEVAACLLELQNYLPALVAGDS